MMAQTQIVQQIIEKKGDYRMALKGNQRSLYDDASVLAILSPLIA